MDQDNLENRLSQITTLWTLIRQAHEDPGEEVRQAQGRLLERYSTAIHRYLIGALRDAEAAEEVFQDFACRFLQGKLRGADPGRGRFRYFLKGVLSHMVADQIKRQRRQLLLHEDHPEPAVEETTLAEADRAFAASWREDLLTRSWAALQRLEQETGQPFFAVLRFRADHPQMRSPEMAEALGKELGKALTPAGIRQTLHRAREKFSDILLQEVLDSIDNPTPDQLEEELVELGLLEYCRPSLERRGAG